LSSALTTRATLTALLEEAQQRGFLGPGPVEAHVDLALDALPLLMPGVRAVDLGSGGGAVGLPLLVLGPPADWVFVEVSEARADFLRRAVGRLQRSDVTVLAEPAEVVGRQQDIRGTADVVVARSFGPPATTAECAAPLLRLGGRLAVTEPPDVGGDRWPPAGVARLGLEVGQRCGVFQTLDQVSTCPERFPRRTGMPRRRPLF
jgi:16S rRNA (guanine527-N7)-methyltransferase